VWPHGRRRKRKKKKIAAVFSSNKLLLCGSLKIYSLSLFFSISNISSARVGSVRVAAAMTPAGFAARRLPVALRPTIFVGGGELCREISNARGVETEGAPSPVVASGVKWRVARGQRAKIQCCASLTRPFLTQPQVGPSWTHSASCSGIRSFSTSPTRNVFGSHFTEITSVLDLPLHHCLVELQRRLAHESLLLQPRPSKAQLLSERGRQLGREHFLFISIGGRMNAATAHTAQQRTATGVATPPPQPA
jgi:hypothetical protein